MKSLKEAVPVTLGGRKMLTEQQLSGIYVPIITPFNSASELDQESLSSYLQKLLQTKLSGIVINGTTGEAPTVTEQEVETIIAIFREAERVVAKTREPEDVYGGRITSKAMDASVIRTASPLHLPLIIGTGTNDTRTTMKRTERAGILGADAALVVAPYYSRPSQAGIVEHYAQVVQVGIPVILYDVPSRTGVAIQVDTMRTILEMEGIIGLKDSTGGVQMVAELSRRAAEHGQTKPVLCGEDANLFAALCCGARGGMLASANVETNKFVEIFNQHSAGHLDEAKLIFDKLLPLIHLMFSESNPAPLKWLLASKGWIRSNQLRLPMAQISPFLQKQLERYV